MTGRFSLKGRHVLAMLLAFFASIVAANAIFITLAVRTFPGEEEKKSYLQGLHFNDRLKERESQAALGWNAEIAQERPSTGEAKIELAFMSRSFAPVTGLKVTGSLSGLVDDTKDRALDFVEAAPGVYRVMIVGIDSGAWRLDATATGRRGEVFTLEKRMAFE